MEHNRAKLYDRTDDSKREIKDVQLVGQLACVNLELR